MELRARKCRDRLVLPFTDADVDGSNGMCQVFAISNLVQVPPSSDKEAEPGRSKGALH